MRVFREAGEPAERIAVNCDELLSTTFIIQQIIKDVEDNPDSFSQFGREEEGYTSNLIGCNEPEFCAIIETRRYHNRERTTSLVICPEGGATVVEALVAFLNFAQFDGEDCATFIAACYRDEHFSDTDAVAAMLMLDLEN